MNCNWNSEHEHKGDVKLYCICDSDIKLLNGQHYYCLAAFKYLKEKGYNIKICEFDKDKIILEADKYFEEISERKKNSFDRY